jgi:hypothetical protein
VGANLHVDGENEIVSYSDEKYQGGKRVSEESMSCIL